MKSDKRLSGCSDCHSHEKKDLNHKTVKRNATTNNKPKIEVKTRRVRQVSQQKKESFSCCEMTEFVRSSQISSLTCVWIVK